MVSCCRNPINVCEVLCNLVKCTVIETALCVCSVNECEASPRPCHPNANCTNTGGSYECHCSVGFTGDGMSCSGRNCLHWYTKSIDSPLCRL